MTNTEIRKANVADLRKEAKARNIDINGMNRADLVEALLADNAKPDEKPAEKAGEKADTVKLVVMQKDGFKANVHPDMIEDYKLGGYMEV